jgi:hypothetical protein
MIRPRCPQAPRHVYCLDKATGKIVGTVASEACADQISNRATPVRTPATDGQHVVAFLAQGPLLRRNEQARKLDLGFSIPAGSMIRQTVGMRAPVIHRDMVILQCDAEELIYRSV